MDVFNELPKDSRVKEIIWDAKYRISHRVISKFNVGNVFFGGEKNFISIFLQRKFLILLYFENKQETRHMFMRL